MLLLILKVHGNTGVVVRHGIVTWYENKGVSSAPRIVELEQCFHFVEEYSTTESNSLENEDD